MATSSRHRSPQPAQSINSVDTSTPPKPRQPPVTLAKRLLFPALPTNDLPPLLKTATVPPELTAELYDFIALALRAFVNPWWTKITRYDKDFLPEITAVSTVVLQSLESRVLAADLSPLVFQDLPAIITQHYQDYRNAASKRSTSYAGGGALNTAHLFHQLQPHMALAADGRLEPEYFRQVIDHVLKSCLPAANYDAEAERYIVREVVLKVLLQDVIPKIIQPWFIQKVILDLLDPSEDFVPLKAPESTLTTVPPSSPSFSFHNIAVFFLSAVQSLSGFCLVLINTYKQAVSTIKLVNKSTPKGRSPSPSPPIPVVELTMPPTPLTPPISTTSSTSSIHSSINPIQTIITADPFISRPDNYALGPLLMFNEIFCTRERLASNMITTTMTLLTTLLMKFLDRLLPYTLDNNLSPQFVTNIVRIAKRTLFPNGYPAPAPPDPTPEEQAIIRARLVSWKPKGSLVHMFQLVLGRDHPATLAAALDPLTNAACNAHLVVLILDRVILALFPELGVHSEDTTSDDVSQ
ncbi:hypothetical protein PC9H_003869 [Pleurotus ostreatus]|uniref:PXA domain-containing protein n=1 Tax=Pleurotus ostreatus TaxID=5322 RepID=A0A8H6ZZ78_PLEOS|nr:uncharacterized protein PC9H_003869 [Pleurotus ostreatus]KAF7437035.1 hypothetical protein PC9H_003869 [Pleurotus ostreatus]KAJ8702876.1 hypothetical protein PTI98_001550 [Pleurotus ostreatus]